MKFWNVLLLGLVGILFLSGCAASSNQPSKRAVDLRDGVDVADFEKLMKEPGVILVDVRDATEFADGHIPGAVNIDVKSGQFVQEVNKLDKTRHYLVYCLAGVRAQKACTIMAEQGFNNYDWLTTGISGWKAQNKPVAK